MDHGQGGGLVADSAEVPSWDLHTSDEDQADASADEALARAVKQSVFPAGDGS